MDETLETVGGVIESVIFSNNQNGYIVFDIESDDGSLITAHGVLGDIVPGEKVLLRGRFVNSPKYGEQFEVAALDRSMPETPEEIAKYLGSGIIPGIRMKTAIKITNRFGDDTLDIIENFPERLCEIKGITIDKAVSMGNAFRKLCGVNTVLKFLSRFNISPTTSVAVWNKYDSSSISVIKSNPYLLCDEGVELSFEVVDKIAEELETDPFSLNRIKAGISFILLENARMGHTCIPLMRLIEKAVQYLNVDEKLINNALEEGFREKRFSRYSTEKDELIYLYTYYKAETYIVDKLSEMLKLCIDYDQDISADIDGVEFEEGITYESLQRSAIEGCLKHNIFILTGGPGTGKTTTLNAVIRLLKKGRKTLSLAAPTGRAANRMEELTGQNAQTIHRLLEVDALQNNLSVFRRNEMNPLKTDVVIIDEMSMVDTLLFEALLRAMRVDSRLIMVGDSEQLPPVGAGNILADLIASDRIKGVRLGEIFRQSSKSLIVSNAHKIVAGVLPELDIRDKDFFFMPSNQYNSDEFITETVSNLVKTRLPNAYGLDPFNDIQVLSPTKIGPAGTRELNKILQASINPPSVKKQEIKFGDIVFRLGDKVMQTSNDYTVTWKRGGEQGMGLYNGDIGFVSGFDRHSGGMLVNFEGRVATIPSQSFNKIEHAYAITVHKSQGSEYRAVIMAISASTRRLLYRSLLYTGVTRARELFILVGNRGTVEEMTRNEQKTERHSCLKEMLYSVNTF